MITRHEEDIQKYENMLENAVSGKPKDSAEILNLRKIELELAKQKE